MEFVTVAIIRKSFGLRGEAKCESLTSYPELRFKKGTKLFLHNPNSSERKEVTLKSKKTSSGVLILGFEEINSPEEMDGYKQFEVDIDKEKAPIPAGEFRYADLIGCLVKNDQGEILGQVTKIQMYAPKPNLVVEREGNTPFSVPFVDAFIKHIDLEKKEIEIIVWEGML